FQYRPPSPPSTYTLSLHDALPILKGSEGRLGVTKVVDGDREGFEDASGEQLHDPSQHLADPLRGDICQLEGLIATAREGRGDLVLGTDIGQSHLHEPAARAGAVLG